VYLIINHAWRSVKKLVGFKSAPNLVSRILTRALTFFVIVIAWVFFRADNLPSAIMMIKSLFGYGGIAWPENQREKFGVLADVFSSWGMEFRFMEYFNGFGNVFGMVLMMTIIFLVPNVQQIMAKYPAALNAPEAGRIQWQPTWKWGLLIGLVALIAILRLGNVTEFLYFQF